MGRTVGRPSSLRAAGALLLTLLAASDSPARPSDDPKPKVPASKKAGASKAKKDAAPKQEKDKTEAEKKADEAAKTKDAALKVAEAYLVLLDKGKYAESWESMTADVRKGITRRKWVDALGKTRAPFGPLRSRKLKRVDMRATEVADRLDEAWVYTDFRTAEGEASSELIIVVLQDGKDWTVNAYYIGNPQTFPKQPVEDKEDPKPAGK